MKRFYYKKSYNPLVIGDYTRRGKILNLEKNTLRQILDENFYKIDQRLLELTQQVDKMADRDMLRIDRIAQVKFRQEELSELLEELENRVEVIEQWSSTQKTLIRHSSTVIICLVIIGLYAVWTNAG